MRFLRIALYLNYRPYGTYFSKDVQDKVFAG